MNRSDFLKMTALAGTAFSIMPAKAVFGNPSSSLRIGVIGTGLRGQELLRLSLQREDTQVVAICDIEPLMLRDALQLFEKAQKPQPVIYTGSPVIYRDMLAKEALDAVIIATPWEWHYPMAMDAMNAVRSMKGAPKSSKGVSVPRPTERLQASRVPMAG